MIIKAKDIRYGDEFLADDGKKLVVAEVKRTRSFRMSLEGYPDAYAIMVFWKKIGDWSLFHPEAEVELLKRREVA